MEATENLEILPIQQTYTNESGEKGIKIRLTYRLLTQKIDILSFIAEFNYVHTVDEHITEIDIEIAIDNAYINYQMRFNENKQGTPLQTN